MTARTIEDQVSSLLSRTVAEPKQLGVQRPELEAAAIFDSIALSLLLKPRAALYFAFLARNALTKAVQDELDIADALIQDIVDLGNQSYRINGAPVLRRAQVALLNMESLPRVSANNSILGLYNKTVTEFLEKHLSKNVRKSGQSEMTRPAAEAEQDLPTTLDALKSAHDEVLDRFYTLATGIQNFESAPLSAIVGTSTVARARADLEELIALVEDGGDPQHSRDMVVRLLSSRAAINTVASPPKWGDGLLPEKTVATTPTGAASQTGSLSHPFTMPSSSVLAISDGYTTTAAWFLPGGAALLVSEAAAYPVTVPANYYLFLTTITGGVSTSVKIPLSGTFSNADGVATQILAAGVSGLQVVRFGSDPSRLLLYMNGADSIAVNSVYVMTPAESRALGVTTTAQVVLKNSAAPFIGLGDYSSGGTTVLASVVVDAINSTHGDLVTASFTADGKISLETVRSDHGTSLRVFGSAGEALGFDGVTRPAVATSCTLSGASLALLQAEDLLVLPGGIEVPVYQALESELVLASEVGTFTGVVSARSRLARCYAGFSTALTAALKTWSATPYVENLTVVDRALAPLVAAQAPAQRKEAIDAVSALKTALTRLLNVLSDAATMLPVRAATAERKMVEGILNTLAERHYERAADLLMKCDLQALMEMDDETASYGGNFMKTASVLARASIKMTDPLDPTEPSTFSVGLR